MPEQKKVGHAQHLKAVNHPIRREILKFVNEKEEILEINLINKLKENNTIDSEDIFKYHMGFLLQTFCVEKIEEQDKILYKILPSGKVIKIELELAERRQNQIEMMEHFDVYDLSDYSILPKPSKEMTLRDYLTKQLGLSDRFLKNDVFVNGKEIQPKDWGVEIVSEKDGVAVTPYIGFNENIIKPIEAKIEAELQKDNKDQTSVFTFLNPNEIETMLNFYGMLNVRYKERANWDGSTSPYTVYFKFFVDLLIEI